MYIARIIENYRIVPLKKYSMNKIVGKLILMLVLIVGMRFCANAQPAGEPDPDAIPLDPGSWILVAAGVGYGVKKWRDTKQGHKNSIYGITEVHANRINEESE